MKLIDGKKIADQMLQTIKQRLDDQPFEVPPLLHIIAPTKDSAAVLYTSMKKKTAEKIGIRCQVVHMGEDVTADRLIDLLQKISNPADRKFPYGVMVQLPMYDHLKTSQAKILDSIPWIHDVDGLTSTNLGKVLQGSKDAIYPATVKAILKALGKPARDDLAGFVKGKHVVIVNNSNLIGKPLGAVLSSYGATVTICNEHTQDLGRLTNLAHILVTATGTPGLITADMIKQDAVVIDVTSVNQGSEIVGDVMRSPELEQKAAWLTPVPGGIGPLTIACLLENLVDLPL